MSFSRLFLRRIAQGTGFVLVFSAGYVSELQKNLETLNKIKAALGGT